MSVLMEDGEEASYMIFKKIVRKMIFLLELTIKEEKKHEIDETGMSIEDLKKDLSNLPVEKGAVLFMHSGFKSLGKLNGGPALVIEAMVDTLVKEKGITIAMPSFTISGSMSNYLANAKPFNVKKTPTVFDAIPQAFQSFSGVVRSIHPTHSVTALGPRAKWLVSDHHTCGSNFGKGSPLGKLLECNGYVVGLGTRLGTVTFYHTLEDIEPNFPRRVYTENSPITVKCIGYSGETIQMQVNAHDPKAFETRIDHRSGASIREIYTAVLNKQAKMQWVRVGKANTWLCKASEMYEVSKKMTYAGLSIYSTEYDIANFINSKIYQKAYD